MVLIDAYNGDNILTRTYHVPYSLLSCGWLTPADDRNTIAVKKLDLIFHFVM